MIHRQHFTLSNVAGRLCVACADSMQDEPVIIINHWPTNQSARQFEECIGKHGRDWVYDSDLGRGLFRIRWGTNWSIHSASIVLANGGQTRPVFSETKEYCCPKSRGKETRYKDGSWQRRMAKGWEWMHDQSQFIARPNVTLQESIEWQQSQPLVAA